MSERDYFDLAKRLCRAVGCDVHAAHEVVVFVEVDGRRYSVTVASAPDSPREAKQ